MNEFHRWVLIVTLIIFGMMILSFMIVYQEGRIKKLDAMCSRIEDKDRKSKKLTEEKD